jgi:hypothetical protein
LQIISSLVAPQVIPRSSFIVHPFLRSATLNVTVPGFDSIDQSTAPIQFRLRWSKPLGTHANDGLAVVTGTIRRGGLAIALGNEIVWNKWGSESFPWAGLWFCAFDESGQPGCFGQV